MSDESPAAEDEGEAEGEKARTDVPQGGHGPLEHEIVYANRKGAHIRHTHRSNVPLRVQQVLTTREGWMYEHVVIESVGERTANRPTLVHARLCTPPN